MVKRTVMVKLPHYIGAIKFVPMILCVVAAIIVACTGKGIDGLEYDNLFISKDVGKLSFSGVFNSIPAILFAYNGYLVVGNLVNKINDPKKTVPRAMSIANSIIIGIYITISITLIVNGATGGIILNIFGEGLGKTLMSIVLFIVSLGSVVLFNAVSFNTVDEAINFKQTIGSVLLNKLDNKKSGLGSLTLNYLLFVLYFIIFSIPSIILDTDAIFDSSSNVGTFITFMLCGILFLGFLIKYFKKKINIKIKFHNLAIIIFSGICVFIIAIYSIFYDFIAEICNDPYGKSVSGIFYQNQGINNILDGLVF
jgi:amino acid transporter